VPDQPPRLDRLVALVPVRSLEGAKARLGEVLDAEERRSLVARLLVRTVDAAAATPGVVAVVVVSPDPAVLELAQRHGAVGVPQAGGGLNEGLDEARARAEASGAHGILVVPGDLPAVDVVELTRLVVSAGAALDGPAAIGAGQRSLVAVVPDRAGTGTNVLLLVPPGAITFHFGEGSRAAHAAAARAAGAVHVELGGPLALDLDTPDDLLAAEAAGLGGLRAGPPVEGPGGGSGGPGDGNGRLDGSGGGPAGGTSGDVPGTQGADPGAPGADPDAPPEPTRPGDALLVLPLAQLPEVHPGDDLASLIGDALAATPGALPLHADDVVVVTQKIVSKAEGARVDLAAVEPRPEAIAFAARWSRDARQVEVVLREAVRVVRMANGVIIAETRHGFVLANAGVDASNVGPEGANVVLLLPADSDASARRIRDRLAARFGTAPGVVVSDSLGRPWRFGITDLALGVAGFRPLEDLRGTRDADGRVMAATVRAVADEIASAAELVLGKAARRPVALVRGASPPPGDGSIRGDVLMPPETDLFR
jgi:coenzyme F420-0:L-glutamate ligase / coenzyme F420-1:gamma-L-glutamate ligase